MLFPLVVAFVAVLLGTALALGPREGTRAVWPIRLVAMFAAVAVILTHLLPEALHELGLRALAGFAAGLALPSLAEGIGSALARRRGTDHGHGHGHGHGGHPGSLAALEIAYVGLVLHRFGDGLSMGAYSRTTGTPWAAAGVVLALAAHIVPVTTVMILAIAALRGRRAAMLRAAGLAAATMSGVVVASVAVSGGSESSAPWISAVVGGLLLHIVAHDVPRPRKPGPGPG
jgi:hypothetical protein